MKLASVLTPMSDENLALAAQTGVECITLRYQGPEKSDWQPALERICAEVEQAIEALDALASGEV